jgi:hypothetical protein
MFGRLDLRHKRQLPAGQPRGVSIHAEMLPNPSVPFPNREGDGTTSAADAAYIEMISALALPALATPFPGFPRRHWSEAWERSGQDG